MMTPAHVAAALRVLENGRREFDRVHEFLELPFDWTDEERRRTRDHLAKTLWAVRSLLRRLRAAGVPDHLMGRPCLGEPHP